MGIVLVLAETAEEARGLWEEHIPAWNAWVEVSGQWRAVAGLERALWIGLDYAAARAALDLAGVVVTPEVWADLRAIEEGAIKELNGGR